MKSFKTLSGNRPWIWAHRGASGYAPENTMEAFRLAHEMGADGVEIDVYFSKDGQIIICHDEKMDRVSNGQGSVTEYTVEELKMFDFGCKFYAGERRGIKIATLDELYAYAHEVGLKINVEVKSGSPDMPAALISKAREYDVEDLIYYSSFNHAQLIRLQEVDPTVRVAPLYGQPLVYMDEYAERFSAWAIHPSYNMLSIFPSLVEDCHKKGILVNPWTANSEESIRACVEAGADGIISNYPDRVRAAIEE